MEFSSLDSLSHEIQSHIAPKLSNIPLSCIARELPNIPLPDIASSMEPLVHEIRDLIAREFSDIQKSLARISTGIESSPQRTIDALSFVQPKKTKDLEAAFERALSKTIERAVSQVLNDLHRLETSGERSRRMRELEDATHRLTRAVDWGAWCVFWGLVVAALILVLGALMREELITFRVGKAGKVEVECHEDGEGGTVKRRKVVYHGDAGNSEGLAKEMIAKQMAWGVEERGKLEEKKNLNVVAGLKEK